MSSNGIRYGAVIPAAGFSRRARPKSVHVHKSLLEVDGIPIIERLISILKNDMGIHEILIIVGHQGDQIRSWLGDGSGLGISIGYEECTDPSAGLAQGILQTEGKLAAPFVVILGDEIYVDSNHKDLTLLMTQKYDAICAVKRTHEPRLIRQNYGVTIHDQTISHLVEKPAQTYNSLLGCGTFVFQESIYAAIKNTAISERTNIVELIDAIDHIARNNGRILPFELQGLYFNVNTADDYNYAQYAVRSRNFASYTISVVIPAFNEEQSIAYVVRDFLEKVHEVIVIDNSSTDDTAMAAEEAGAKTETVSLEGYGDTIRFGLDLAQGDILVVVEADYSFRSRDLGKMLEYLKDADMVVGTRTTRELVEQATNMRGVVRWANVFVAKFIELLWWSQEPRFTDVGCTYRAIWKSTYRKIRSNISSNGPEFSPEMMISVLQADKRVIEIPVSYHNRVGGQSKHSKTFWHLSRTALRMLTLIIKKRVLPSGKP